MACTDLYSGSDYLHKTRANKALLCYVTLQSRKLITPIMKSHSREDVRNLAAAHACKIALWFEVLPKYVVPLNCTEYADDYHEVLLRVFLEEKRRLNVKKDVGFRVNEPGETT